MLVRVFSLFVICVNVALDAACWESCKSRLQLSESSFLSRLHLRTRAEAALWLVRGSVRNDPSRCSSIALLAEIHLSSAPLELC